MRYVCINLYAIELLCRVLWKLQQQNNYQDMLIICELSITCLVAS